MKLKINQIATRTLKYLGVSHPCNIKDNYTRDAIALAQCFDCDNKLLAKKQQHPERVKLEIHKRSCNWYLPVFDNAFYGGVMTILRLATYLQKTDGVHQRFLICGECDHALISAKIIEAFPTLISAEIIILDSELAIQQIPLADYSIATLWTTAYVLLKVENTGYKFYMIQDYEPLFYPSGSTYAQAEFTYRFGFYGIANTQSLWEIYTKEYGGKATMLLPNVDPSVFYPTLNPRSNHPRKIFYYARPGTPRNCFELAIAAFKLLKHRLGDNVEIICAGANWNPADYGLENSVKTIGLLPYIQTGELYRSCHIGLAMMMSKHPSYLPFEMMGCGMLVVSNRNPANTWFLKDKENCLLAEPSASCLAETLMDAVENYEKYESIRQCGISLMRKSHSDWESAMRGVADFMHQPKELDDSNASTITSCLNTTLEDYLTI